MRINGTLIYRMSSLGKLRYLAVFIRLKGLKVNSCIFDYTPESLAAKTELSKSSIRKYVKFFLKEGWAYMDHGNLIFRRLNQIGWQRARVPYKIEGNAVKEILNSLHLNLLRHRVNQSKWYTQMCLDLSLADEIKRKKLMSEIKRWEKNTGKRFKESEGLSKIKALGHSKGFKISLERIAKWLNCKMTKAHQIIHELAKNGMIEIYKGGYVVVSKFKKLKSDGDKMFISRHGDLVRVNCYSYNFFV